MIKIAPNYVNSFRLPSNDNRYRLIINKPPEDVPYYTCSLRFLGNRKNGVFMGYFVGRFTISKEIVASFSDIAINDHAMVEVMKLITTQNNEQPTQEYRDPLQEEYNSIRKRLIIT